MQICIHSNMCTLEFILQGGSKSWVVCMCGHKIQHRSNGEGYKSAPQNNVILYPQLVNNEHILTGHPLCYSFDTLSDISNTFCVHFNASKHVKGLELKGAIYDAKLVSDYILPLELSHTHGIHY